MSFVVSHPLSTTTTTAKPALTIPASARVHPTTTATTPTAVPKSFHSEAVIARPPVRAHASRPVHISTEAIVLAAIAALLLLACAIWAFARSRAYEPHWLLSLRHAMAEAGFRMSATWAEFSDWVRLGR